MGVNRNWKRGPGNTAAALLLAAATLLPPTTATAQHALGGAGPYDPAVPTPAAVLGHELGDAFTPHHRLVAYLDRLAAASDRIRVDTVATTWEGRPVLLATATSAANQARLDHLMAGAGRLADPRGASDAELERLVADQPTSVWLGYTVHGDEASGLEAAMAVLYQLAAGQDPATLEILENVVVLIDPVQNPDGHERHVAQVAWDLGRFGPDPYPAAVVHGHDWHGARTNHYLFDLNRDWLVHAHPETRGRMDVFRRWYPHVAVDLHEMGASSTYFFAPPMEPVNANIHPLIREGWALFGQANADAFAEQGWGFFTREGFDEFFPGYGPSWPLYTGAVGMTYEEASSEGGAIRRDDGTLLTLAEAARHHYTASMATLRTAARNRARRVADYLTFRQDASLHTGGIRTVILGRDDQGRADSLAAVLLRHGIEIGKLAEARQLRATPFDDDDARTVRVPAGSYVVDLAQPQGVLARTLLEPDPALDPDFVRAELERREAGLRDRFYDMTGWALPFLFRVPAWHTTRPVPGATPIPPLPTSGSAHGASTIAVAPAAAGTPLPGRARFAYAFEPGSEASLRLLAGLLADDVRVRHATEPFRAGGQEFPHGAFVVLVHRNRGDDDGATLHETIRTRAGESGARVVALGTARAEEGTDLGSNTVRPLPRVRVALAGGAGISSYSYGAAWYVLDRLLAYPSTRIELGDLDRALDDFDVVVLPSTWDPGSVLGDRGVDALEAWVRDGGTLVTLDGATRWLASEEGFARLTTRSTSEPTAAQREAATAATPDAEGAAVNGDAYVADTERRLPAAAPGVIARAVVDRSSPLTAGITESEIAVVLSGGTVYDAPADARPGEAVIRYVDAADRLRLAGFLWPELPERVAGGTYLWTEELGAGRLIAFTADPNFRAMTRGLLPLFANAVLLGGSF